MRKPKNLAITAFLIFLLGWVMTICKAEDLTITTYYPSPYGSYNELGTNKLAVDIEGVAVSSEYEAMRNGDAHIGRSLIVGAGGSGFAYDETLGPPDIRPADGDVLIKGRVGIGTTAPQNTLHVEKARSDTISSAVAAYRLGGTDVYLFGGSKLSSPYSIWMQAFRPSDDATFPLVLNPNGGNVGIGMTSPDSPLTVYGTSSANAVMTVGAGNGVATDKVFRILTDTSPITEGVTVLRNGNVGIGTATPGEKLEVNGIVRSDNSLKKYVGRTANFYDGSGVGGYAGGNAKCAAEFPATSSKPAARMAYSGDFLIPPGSILMSGWISTMIAADFSDYAGRVTQNDCSGWNTNSNSFGGTVFQSGPGLDRCDNSHPILCVQ